MNRMLPFFGKRGLRIVDVWSDGSCRNAENGVGVGAYAAVIKFAPDFDDLDEVVLSRAFIETSAQRMELMAIVAALSRILAMGLAKSLRVLVHTDAKLIVDALNAGALAEWVRQGLPREKGMFRRDGDLWVQLHHLMRRLRRSGNELNFVWVRAHAGNPMNNRVDELAKRASKSACLAKDERFVWKAKRPVGNDRARRQ